MRLTVFLIVCLPAAAGGQSHYVRQAARSIAMDSTAESVVTYFDQRVVIWLDSSLSRLRKEFVEGGACLRISQRIGPDAFKVDSIIGPLLDENDPPPTWRSAHFTCPDSFAPIHWHVITAANAGGLHAGTHVTEEILRGRCRISEPDRSPFWSRFPFVAMQCGVGIDSITVYRVRTR